MCLSLKDLEFMLFQMKAVIYDYTSVCVVCGMVGILNNANDMIYSIQYIV